MAGFVALIASLWIASFIEAITSFVAGWTWCMIAEAITIYLDIAQNTRETAAILRKHLGPKAAPSSKPAAPQPTATSKTRGSGR